MFPTNFTNDVWGGLGTREGTGRALAGGRGSSLLDSGSETISSREGGTSGALG